MQPLDVIIVGDALNSFGFQAFNTISGLGLNTQGFLWDCSGIWSPADDPTLTTTWENCSSPNDTTEVCVE